MPLVGFEMYTMATTNSRTARWAGKPGTYLFFYPSAEQSRYSRHQTGLTTPGVHGCRPARPVNSVHTVVADSRANSAECGARAAGHPNIRSRTRDLLARPVGLSCSKRYAITTAD